MKENKTRTTKWTQCKKFSFSRCALTHGRDMHPPNFKRSRIKISKKTSHTYKATWVFPNKSKQTNNQFLTWREKQELSITDPLLNTLWAQAFRILISMKEVSGPSLIKEAVDKLRISDQVRILWKRNQGDHPWNPNLPKSHLRTQKYND